VILGWLINTSTGITDVTIEFFPEFLCIFLAQLILRVYRYWRMRKSSSALASIFIMSRWFRCTCSSMSGIILSIWGSTINFFLSPWHIFASFNALQTWIRIVSVTHKWIPVQMASLMSLNAHLEWQVVILKHLLSLSVAWSPYESVVYLVVELRHIYLNFIISG